ncbi:class 3 adenylate cyclase [Comamonas sp. BIGb0124]|uniref:adenylate/guanylate cyclase domain-containing protein n=1 Tax=Comamonas sp. BIGb0124 TaxID=2485130 RepID=UPI000F490273|nr:adenylate/guanylate cyclase domain-containing protein [Comamonas sp. BIGb0124]ROR18474.1 class 3 adenylate cyclase [Comamonas sp. BIGb0124]
MTSRNWKRERAQERIRGWFNQVSTVEIKEYLRDTNLTGIRSGVAYRIDGVHLYVDILNLDEMLGVTGSEGVRAHSRTLRFLDRHYRAVRDILKGVDAIQVDFHNQRLHAVIAKPYGNETGRIHKAVATAQLIIDVLQRTGENSNDPLPAAKVRAGIDSGKALAVNNGRRGNREPLFLGEPANLAAKRSGGGADTGIYMTNTARSVVGWNTVDDEDKTALTKAQIEKSEDVADLHVAADDVVMDWEEGLSNQPLGSFEFKRHTPPFADLDLETLTPGNSRRQDSTSIYADIDGFTAYVSDRIDTDDSAKDVVRALHVLRAELDAVLHADFSGRKIRFIGDCIHGVLIEGTSHTTDDAVTTKNAMLCAAALRSSFGEAIAVLKEKGIDAGELGIQIGLEHGPTAITRLGYKGERTRCCISRAVLRAEDEQRRCKGNETAIGPTTYNCAPEAFRILFSGSRIRSDFDYDEAVDALADEADSQKATSASALATTLPSIQPDRLGRTAASATATFTLPAQAAGPTNPNKVPAGFA